MKKIVIFFISAFLLVGCTLGNNPTSKVEELLGKYQRLENEIKDEIEVVLSSEDLTDIEKDRYRKLLEKQYKNLTYEIQNEREDGNKAIITTQIEVIDYKKAIRQTDTYYATNKNYTKEEYNNTKLINLENMKEKVVYTIEFSVTKDNNGVWSVDGLSDMEKKKIQGMY